MVRQTKSIVISSLVFVSVIDVISQIGGTPVPQNATPVPPPPKAKRGVEFTYSNQFEEIDHDIWRVVRDVSNVRLSCHVAGDKEAMVKWRYHGVETPQHIKYEVNEQEVSFDLSSGPPVVRMECWDYRNKSFSNNSIIYTGEADKPPYLYHSGKSIRAVLLNGTTARLPCILNYPVDNSDHREIQLWKDGELIEDKDGCLSYTPELGFTLNLTALDNPIGHYECKVTNSTEDDVVTVDFNIDSLINVKYPGHWTEFYARQPVKHTFQCEVPKYAFADKIEWYYKLENGSYIPTEGERTRNNHSSDYYSESIKLVFPSASVTQLVCASWTNNETQSSYNNTYDVKVIEPLEPEILNPVPKAPVTYTEGKNLTCLTETHPTTWTWLKNGEPIREPVNITDSYVGPVFRSTLGLPVPLSTDVENNYTCVLENFLGSTNLTFRVQNPQQAPSPSSYSPVIIVVVVAIVAAVIILMLLIFFKIQITPRRFSEENIRRFIEGVRVGARQAPYNELEPYAYAYSSYDYSKEIEIRNLDFDKELKGGNFGKVHLGYVINKATNSRLPVAIKTIKDNPTATIEQLEHAFENFLNEIKLMQNMGPHPNVVGYVGAVTSDLAKYTAYLVVEYCSQGDLATYMKSFIGTGGSFHDDILGLHSQTRKADYSSVTSGSAGVLKTSHLMKWSQDIATGMEYIASKNLVHMDLAARNVLLAYGGINTHDDYYADPETLIAKISDFGLSKDLELEKDYYQIVFHPEWGSQHKSNRPRQLPLRWLSIEALESLRFTTQSDVWAFGVTLWEMFTIGSKPYEDLRETGTGEFRGVLLSHLRNDNRLPEPPYAPPEICDLMRDCWNEIPEERPSFRDLREWLQSINENRRNEDGRNNDNESAVSTDNPYSNTVTAQMPNTGYTTVGFVENLAYNDVGDFPNEEDGGSDDGDSDDDTGVQNHNAINS